MKKWTVGKATFPHMPGFIWAIYWNGTERGAFDSEEKAQAFCDELNQKQGIAV